MRVTRAAACVIVLGASVASAGLVAQEAGLLRGSRDVFGAQGALALPGGAHAQAGPGLGTPVGGANGARTASEGAATGEGAATTEIFGPEPLETLPAEAVPPRRARSAAPQDPYEALGIRVSSFLLYPSIEFELGAGDNLERTAGASRDGGFGRVIPAALLRSDWSRHALEMRATGAFDQAFVDGEPIDGPEYATELRGRVDVTRDLKLDLNVERVVAREEASDPDLPEGAIERPETRTTTAAATLTRQFNRLQVAGTTSYLREEQDDVPLFGGGVAPGAEESSTEIGWRLRVGYEISPKTQPFVAGYTNRREFDARVSSDGFLLGSTGFGGEVGVALAPLGPLSGEIALGYETRIRRDDRLENLSGLIGRGSLVWQATGLTRVSLAAATDLDEGGGNSAGSVQRSAEVTVEHALRRHLIVTATGEIEVEAFEGGSEQETTTSAILGVEYKLSRRASLKAALETERLTSTVPGEDYTANIILVGLRLQR